MLLRQDAAKARCCYGKMGCFGKWGYYGKWGFYGKWGCYGKWAFYGKGTATTSGVLDHVASGTDPVRVSP